MPQMKWLLTMCVSPVVAVAFAAAMCGALIVSMTIELHQQLWESHAGRS